MPGPTPLLWAVENRHDEVVGELLELGDIDPNISDTESGRTPLSLAVINGSERIVSRVPNGPRKTGLD